MTRHWKPSRLISIVMNTLLLSSFIVSGQVPVRKRSNVELRIRPSELINGVPGTISFVFVNIADHEVRIPPVSRCIPAGRYAAAVKLGFEFAPLRPPTTGGISGGCGGGVDHLPGILEQAKSWARLKPGASFTVSYKRTELFVYEQAPGGYEFWGEYQPPTLTTEDITALEHSDIDFAREPLRSPHLRFSRPE
jgi:hypothetical protein